MLYVLKRKDEIVTLVDFLEDGGAYKFHQDLVNPELAPLHDPDNHDWLKQWWKRRSVPISQGHIRSMLEKKGCLWQTWNGYRYAQTVYQPGTYL